MDGKIHNCISCNSTKEELIIIKKAKSSLIIVVIITLIGVIVGATYMWFFSDVMTWNPGKVTTAHIGLQGQSKASFNIERVLPGQPVALEDAFSLKYTGNRYGILRISFDENSDSLLRDDISIHPDYIGLSQGIKTSDYYQDSGTWKFTPKRLEEIFSLNWITGTSNITFYPNATGSAMYALVAPEDSDTELLHNMELSFSGEFGGGFTQRGATILSPSRQFEQNSILINSLCIDAFVVQCTREAVIDTMGQDALDEIESIPALVNAIGTTPDTRDSWAYLG